MSKTKILVVLDEWYVWAAADLPPSKIPSSRVLSESQSVIKVDAKTANRWRTATRAFERMNQEIGEMMMEAEENE